MDNFGKLNCIRCGEQQYLAFPEERWVRSIGKYVFVGPYWHYNSIPCINCGAIFKGAA